MASKFKAHQLDVFGYFISALCYSSIGTTTTWRPHGRITPRTFLFLSDSFCCSWSSAASIQVFEYVCVESNVLDGTHASWWYPVWAWLVRRPSLSFAARTVFSPDRARTLVSSGQTRSSNYSRTILYSSQGNTPATRTWLATPVEKTTSISSAPSAWPGWANS